MRDWNRALYGSFEKDSMLILIADDVESVRTLVSKFVQRAGHDVVLAGDGIVACAALSSQPRIAVVITDYRMPGKGGLEVACLSKTLKPDRPVVLMSAEICQTTDDVDIFLRKPVEITLKRISEILAQFDTDPAQ